MSKLVDPEESSVPVEDLIHRARAGDNSGLGCLLDYYEKYLLKVANANVDPELSVKTAPSDLVQETFQKAQEHYDQFRGETEPELVQWLKQILQNEIENARRRYVYTLKRSITREVASIESGSGNLWCSQSLEDSATPDRPVLLDEMLELYEKSSQMLPDDYRRVIELRSLQKKPFREVAQILDKRIEATQKLWVRAILRLKEELLKCDPNYHERF